MSRKGDQHSLILVFVLGLAAMFSILYVSSIFSEAGHAHYFDNIPTEPRISQLEAIEVTENHVLSQIEGIEEIKLAFPLYNYSSTEYYSNREYQEYRQNLQFGWDFGHVKENPELLNLQLLFVHRNGTSYAVNSIDHSIEKMCDEPSPVCPMGRSATEASRDRLVYGAEVAWLPFSPDISHNYGWYTVDAETGEIVWNNIDHERNRKPMPDVNFDNRTIRQLLEERLNPPETAYVDILRGASLESNNDLGYKPENIRVTLGIDNTIVWKNNDLVAHTIVSDNSYSNEYTGQFESEFIKSNSNFEYTFIETGKYPYHCDIHPWMTGTVEVIEGFS